MTAEKIMNDWKQKRFKPVYWFEGEEEYYIDELTNFAEHHLLPAEESAFNLSVFYGKDAAWPDVINACRKYPMFGHRQVVLLKEAQQMREIEKLEPYIENPLPSTIFIVSYKNKKIDGRFRIARLLKEKAEVFSAKKMYDNQLPQWTQDLVKQKGYAISPKALLLLVEHIGNDLSRINNELDKILINLGGRKNITEDDIERFVGVSKEYNLFELQDALVKKNMSKAIQIVQYFEANPKAAPIQMILPALYNFFSKMYMLFGIDSEDEKAVAARLGINPFFAKEYLAAAKKYSYDGIESALLLLHEYNLKSLGVNSAAVEDGSLLKEMIAKIIA